MEMRIVDKRADEKILDFINETEKDEVRVEKLKDGMKVVIKEDSGDEN